MHFKVTCFLKAILYEIVLNTDIRLTLCEFSEAVKLSYLTRICVETAILNKTLIAYDPECPCILQFPAFHETNIHIFTYFIKKCRNSETRITLLYSRKSLSGVSIKENAAFTIFSILNIVLIISKHAGHQNSKLIVVANCMTVFSLYLCSGLQ